MSQIQPGDSSERPADAVDQDVQREIEEALRGQNVEALMDAAARDDHAGDSPGAVGHESGSGGTSEPPSRPREFHHEVRRGRIAAIRGEDVFVELTGEAAKMQGVAPLSQFDRSPRLGSIMDFVVERIDESQGLVYLSREGAVSRATWEQMQRGAVVEARVTSTNKGGLELEMVGGIQAFMPASQIDVHHVGELEPLVGQKLEAMVQEIDRRSKKVVLNRRQLLEHRREQAKAKLFEEIEEGQIREGNVSNLVDFGAFVDLGGIDGLIHVSDLSYSHVDRPSDVIKRGEQVKVKVLKIDRESGRIGLGLKQVQPDPWENVGDRIRPGDQVTARVLRTAHFGAFVEVESGIEGLLPISEMSWKRIHQAQEVVSEGQVIRVCVLNIEPDKQRLSLSLKQVGGDPWIGAERKYEKNSKVEGKVIGSTDFGAFVELEPGVEGLVHISELADRRVDRVADVVAVGDVKELRVLDVDEEQRRIRLSMREEHATAAAEPGRGEVGTHHGRRPGHSAKPRASKRHRDDLKGGMDVGGIGLGNLRLDDLK